MKPEEVLKAFISRSLGQNKAFALWFLPGENRIRALIQQQAEVEELKRLEDLHGRQGFVFVPFDQESTHPMLLLQEGRYFGDYESMEKWAGDAAQKSQAVEGSGPPLKQATKEVYLQQCNSIIRQIKNTGLAKVVLSRQMIIERDAASKHTADILIQMKQSYPGAFCYLFYSRQSGMWMGASPEILLQEKQDHYLSIALAGTRPASASGDDAAWPEKDLKEQAFVSDFIIEKIQESGIQEFSVSGPETFKAGQVEHLRTDFRISKPKAMKRLGHLLQALHPTPAVCGTPTQQAMQLIRETENHDRVYYCGFFGPLNLDESVNLYVNLRCMKIQPEEFILYVGGGILEDSVAEDEWNETELKARTLLSIIQDKKAT